MTDSNDDLSSRFSLLLTLGLLLLATVAYSFRFVSFLDAKWLVLAVGLLPLALLHRPRYAGARLFLPLIVGLLLALLVHGLMNPAADRVAVYRTTAQYSLLLLYAVLLIPTFVDERGRKHLTSTVLYASLLITGVAFMQGAGVLDWALPSYPAYNQPFYGVFGNQNLNASLVAMGFAVAVHRLLNTEERKILLVVWVVMLFAALLLLGSRSAFAGAVAAALVASVDARKRLLPYLSMSPVKRFLIINVVGLFVILPFISITPLGAKWSDNAGGMDVGGSARIWIWGGAKELIREHPVLGVGPGNFRYAAAEELGKVARTLGIAPEILNEQPVIHAHSEPVHIWAEAGLIGLALVLIFFLPALRRAGPERAALVAFGVFALANPVLESPVHALLVLLLAGGALGVATDSKSTVQKNSYAQWVSVGLACCIALLVVYSTLLPSFRLAEARDRYDEQPAAPNTKLAYSLASDGYWRYPDAPLEWVLVLLESGSWGPDLRGLPLDGGKIHYTKALLYLNVGDLDSGLEEYRLCLDRWPGFGAGWIDYIGLLEPAKRRDAMREALPYLTDAEQEGLLRAFPRVKP